ncbi:hypothetical protein BK748_16520 [Bacillus thuringiensis serovar graciosensis]|uniref:Crystaline entomocidal protoxin n=2 Tax=Bacillus cereus group TaxID=86661 RepID=U5KRX0_BACTU|nr:pesticidal protein [Bacillus thuringiensis]OTY55646.1 hypothetical protein BK748_16520 [Bacillus thuringiensis serovar graciosensis]
MDNMTNLSDLYSAVPYNIMVTPPLKESSWDDFTEFIKELKGGWEEFEKTGYSKPYLNTLDVAINLYKSGTLDYTALAKSFLSIGSALGEFIPGGAVVVPILSGLVDLIFPHLFGSKSSNSQTEFFDAIIKEVQKMIDKEIQDFTTSLLQANIQGFAEAAKLFQNQIQSAIGAPHAVFGPKLDQGATCNTSPCKTPTKEDLLTVEMQFTASNTTMASQVPLFLLTPTSSDSDTNRETIMLTLPMFVTAATVHLSLYQGYIQFMQKWNSVYPEIDIESRISELGEYIESYSKKALDIYNQYAPTYDINNKDVLNKYIQYNRVMITQVFDMVSMWPSFFPQDYPAKFKTDQTRIAFGNIVGPTEDQPSLHFDLYDVYKNQLPNNDIFNYFYNGMQLDTFDLFSDGDNQKLRNYFTGIKGYYKTYNENVITQDDPGTGRQNIAHSFSSDEVKNLLNINMGSVKTQYLDYNLFYYNCKTSNPGKTPSYTTNDCNQIDIGAIFNSKDLHLSNNTSYSNQKLQAIYPVRNPKQVWGGTNKAGFIYTLVDYDLFPQNIIGSANKDGSLNTNIQGFPAEKGTLNLTAEPLTKVLEPINSAAAVNLKFQQILALPITNVTDQNYEIRVRYASKSDISIFFHIQTPSDDLNRGNQTLKNTENATDIAIQGNNGIYTLQTLAEKVSLPSGNLTVFIQNNSNSDLFLDRIEFIPLSQTPDTFPLTFNPPETTTQPNTTKTIWSGLKPANTFSIQGTVSNDVSITFQLYMNDNLVQEIPVKGPGHGYSSMVGCLDKSSPISQPNIENKEFNKLILKELSDKAPDCFNSTLSNTYKVNITIDNKSQSFTTPEDLEKITNQVNQLFTSSAQTELAQTVTDYGIDQVVLKVNALSDDVFGVEKKALRKLVNQAKQLSKARNVLVGGNFEKGHEWVLGREATTVADHDLFKGDHLLLPPPTMYPSYAYQKIDESKLKSNTRYTVSGFVAQSEHLEVVVSRYGKEVHDMLDVPYEEALPITSDERPNCCKPSGCQCPSCNGDAPDSHFFSYSIDVGSLQSDVNLGIEFGLRIAKSNGFAKISNLEIKEDRPLTEKEIKKIQRKEQKWKKTFDQEQAELAATLQPTLNQINALYQNEDWNSSIHPHVTYQHLSDIVLPTLPKQTHWFMEDREGEHVVLTQQFQQALDRAFQQIEEQNLIHNGNFANGLTDWTVTGDAQITIYDEDPVLELAHWDASVSQTIEIIDFEEEKEYKLRVRGKGKGTVTVQHGEEELETMTFNTSNFTTQEQTFYFEGNTVDIHVQSENNTFLVDSVELIEVVEE